MDWCPFGAYQKLGTVSTDSKGEHCSYPSASKYKRVMHMCGERVISLHL